MEDGACAVTMAGAQASQVRLRSKRHVVGREDGWSISQIDLSRQISAITISIK